MASRSCCCNFLFSSRSLSACSRSRLVRSRPRDELRPRHEFQPSVPWRQRPRAMKKLSLDWSPPPPPWWEASRWRACATAMTARARWRARRARRCHDASVVALSWRASRLRAGGRSHELWRRTTHAAREGPAVRSDSRVGTRRCRKPAPPTPLGIPVCNYLHPTPRRRKLKKWETTNE